jgi:phosphatidylserine/phosphatidylglycerophosphate/cardiolipin synthase-like enzyme
MKKIINIILLALLFTSIANAQNTILEARGMPEGTVVTVKGIATNGTEFGIIRYMQDNTAGIAAYGALTGTVNRGDSITVTGTLKMYNQLLELDPITSVIVRSTGNTLPSPTIITPAQISEPFEAMLLMIKDATFKDAGLSFAGNKKYEFTANGETGFIYVKTGQDIVGTTIPNTLVDITAICSQYDFANPNGGYQLLPRDLNDIHMTSSIYLTGTLSNTAFTKTSLDYSWATNIAGTTEMFYGPTPETVAANIALGTGGSINHSISISGLSAGEITWVQAFSVSGSDTAKSSVRPYATISNSGGEMKIYFNSPVDISYSKGVDAIYLHNLIDDTLINYINRAKYTIDFTIYNFNNDGISNISNALKAAANRGVRVRVIGCGTTDNLGIDELIGSAVHLLIGPSGSQRDGIMHNKFIVFDAESSDPNDPLVWTGSTNFTDGQINLDANNVIIVQDQSLARSYQIEFEEMWGSNSDNPDAIKARFGSTKKNNTPHEFVINGKRVECYFSPTDGVNGRVVEVINTADNDLSIATMLITRTDMADAIAARKSTGVSANVITNNASGNSTTVNDILSASLGVHYTFDGESAGILHNKYMIVDQDAPASDPIVLTGSHNWSASADNDNDENTLVVHDATIANIYYQQFAQRFVDNLGVLLEITGPPTAVDDIVETGVNLPVSIIVLANDELQGPVVVSIEQNAINGNAQIPSSPLNSIMYTPNQGILGKDSVTYRITYVDAPELYATAKIYISVVDNFGVDDITSETNVIISPNPIKDGVINMAIKMPDAQNGMMQLMDMTGKILLTLPISLKAGNNTLSYPMTRMNMGVYSLRLILPDKTWSRKIIFE